MIVLGIDPGLSRCGYAAIEAMGPTRAAARVIGVLTTPPSDPLPSRLAELRSELARLMAEVEPDVVVVEHVFFQVNVRTAMSVGQASGLALAEAAARRCTVAQYTPNQVKEAITGWGGAGKVQVQKMVQARLGLATAPKPADAADACALALCYLAVAPMAARVAAARAAAGGAASARAASASAPSPSRFGVGIGPHGATSNAKAAGRSGRGR